MSVRQRLRSVIESRQASQLCWRCALGNFRHSSTTQPPGQKASHNRVSIPVSRAKSALDLGVPVERRTPIREHIYDKIITDPPKAEKARVKEAHDELILPQEIITRGYQSFNAALRSFSFESDTSDDAVWDFGRDDKLNTTNAMAVEDPHHVRADHINRVARRRRNRQELEKEKFFRHVTFNGRREVTIKKHFYTPSSNKLYHSKDTNPKSPEPYPDSSIEIITPTRDKERQETACSDSARGSTAMARPDSDIDRQRHRPILSLTENTREVERIVIRRIPETVIRRSKPSLRHPSTCDSPVASREATDELDWILEKIGRNQKPSPECTAALLPRSSTSLSSPSRPGRIQDPRPSQSRLSRTYATAASRICQQRLTPTSSTQIPDGTFEDTSVAYSTGTPRSEDAGESIREHLMLWKTQQGNCKTATRPADFDSRVHSGSALNNITQSGSHDENYIASAPDEVLDLQSLLTPSLEDSITEILDPQVFIRPGDLVEVPQGSGGDVVLCIVVKVAPRVGYFYTERGTWNVSNPQNIGLSIPHVASLDELSGLLPYLPSQENASRTVDEPQPVSSVPRNVGSRLIEKMAHFTRASDAVFRMYAHRLNRAYEIISQEQCKGQNMIGLEDAALRILEKKNILDLTPPMIHVVHRVLHRTQNRLLDRHLQRMNPKFEILPRETLARLHAVKGWTRIYQDIMVADARDSLSDETIRSLKGSVNPLATFAAKARKVIERSRQDRPLSSIGTIGSSVTKIELTKSNQATWAVSEEHQEQFDHNEQQIISFVYSWAASEELDRTSNLDSIGPIILRAVGMYEGMVLDRATGFTLLQELGIVKPWERKSLFSAQLGLPGYDPHHPTTVLQHQALESLSCLSLPLPDSMAKYRKDWINLPVFCIDGTDTLERDDGISLEAVDGEESSYWVHVHVANPSAFLDKDSPISRYAGQLTASIYFPEHVYPMMEGNLSQKYFSLADGRPCITFSAKISAEGDMIEKSISHGVLRDVRYITLQQVKQALSPGDCGVQEEDQVSLLKVGGKILPSQSPKLPPSPEAMKILSESDVEVLQNLQKLSQVLHSRRIDADALDFSRASRTTPAMAQVYISDHGSQVGTIDASHTRYIMGDPIISISQVHEDLQEVQDMVMEFMVLAGRTCAMWCSERNIPIPYRGVVRNPDPSPSPETYREEILVPAITSHGHADGSLWLRYMSLVGSIYASSRPLEHTALGLPVYCKTTSPLRRYGDLFTHWQVEAALRHERSAARSLIDCAPATYDGTSVLPFSNKQVEDVARTIFARERRLQAAERQARGDWVAQALHRALYFNEAPLPDVFEFTVRALADERSPKHRGVLHAFNRSILIHGGKASDNEGGYRINDVWEGKLVAVVPYSERIEVQPVRLIRREETG